MLTYRNFFRTEDLSPQPQGEHAMIARKSALMSASILTAVGAVFWVGSAIGAPRPPAYLQTSAVISAPAMPEPGVADSNLELAPNLQRQVVDYPTAAVRPKNSVLDSGKFSATFGFRAADWRDAVDRTVASLFARKAAQ